MKIIFSLFLAVFGAGRLHASETNIDARIASHIPQIVALAASSEIVQAVLAQNLDRRPSFQAMTQEKWAALSRMDPFIFDFKKNAVAERLRKMPRTLISEAFVSDAAGYKVAFIEKPTSWCHKGKPKHDEPMLGKIWRGPIEIDASSGTKQVQISVPVLSEGRPVGSLVVGLNIFQLVRE